MKRFVLFLLLVLCSVPSVSAQFNKQQIEWGTDGSSIVLIRDNSVSELTVNSMEAKSLPYTPEAGEFILDSSAVVSAVAVYNGSDTLKVIYLEKTEDPLTIPVQGTVMGAEFSPDGTSLLVYYGDALRTDVFPLNDVPNSTSYEGFSTAAPVYESQWAPDGQHLLWKARGTLQVQNLSDSALSPQISLWDFPQAFALDKNCSCYAVALSDMENPGTIVVLIDTLTGLEMKRYVLGDMQVNQLLFNQAGDKLFVISRDSLLIFKPETGEVLNRSAIAESVSMDAPSALTSFALSPDESKGAFLLSDGSVRFVYFPELMTR